MNTPPEAGGRRLNPFRWFATGPDAEPIRDPKRVDALYRSSRLSVLVSITLGYGFLYTCRLGLSVVKKPLIDGGVFSAEDLGVIGAALFYGYAVGKLFNGFLADHANIRKFLAFGVLCSGLINIVMGGSPLVWVWAVLWGFNGWFQGFGSPASGVSLSNWFSTKERGTFYGIWSTSHSIGEGLTYVVSAFLVTALGWRAGFMAPGVFCVLLAVVLYHTLRDRPETLGLPPVAEWRHRVGAPATVPDATDAPPAEAALPTPDEVGKPAVVPGRMAVIREQARLFLKPTLWVLGLSSATMYVSRYAINSWGILYLQEAKGYSLVEAGSILGANAAAGIVGAVAYGVISDRFFGARRPPVTLIFGILEILALLVIFFSPPGHPWILTAAFIVYGFTLSGLLAVLGGLFAIDIVGRKATGAAMGLVGAFSYLGAALQEYVSGRLITAGTTMVGETRHYDFTNPVVFWVGSSVISMLLAASLWKVKVRE